MSRSRAFWPGIRGSEPRIAASCTTGPLGAWMTTVPDHEPRGRLRRQVKTSAMILSVPSVAPRTVLRVIPPRGRRPPVVTTPTSARSLWLVLVLAGVGAILLLGADSWDHPILVTSVRSSCCSSSGRCSPGASSDETHAHQHELGVCIAVARRCSDLTYVARRVGARGASRETGAPLVGLRLDLSTYLSRSRPSPALTAPSRRIVLARRARCSSTSS